MEFIQKTKTDKGFGYLKFNDVYGQICSMQESSLVDQTALWLGVEFSVPKIEGGLGEPVMARMHLNQEQVARLLPYLHKFVEDGTISAELQ
jgi:hypothetical protein